MRAVKGNFKKYWKYVDTENLVIPLYSSNNTSYIDSTTNNFVVGSVTAWSTTQKYVLNEIISSKDISYETSGWIQGNAGWRMTISGIRKDGTSETIINKDFGYGVTPSFTGTYDCSPLAEYVSFTIYVYCYRRSEEYCYGSITISLKYTKREIIESTASDYDFITTRNFALPTKVERSYWKYKYIPWENPVLSANGAMGGSEYACTGNMTTGAAWQAFDGNTGTIAGVYWGTGGRPTLNLILYCPNPVKVTEAKLWWISDPAQSSSCFKDIYCYGSNDNENWTQIGQVANQCGLAGHWTTMDCSGNTQYYKYYKFTSTQSVGASYEDSNYFGEIKYSGEERIVEPATESDYDFYIDTPIIKAFGDK